MQPDLSMRQCVMIYIMFGKGLVIIGCDRILGDIGRHWGKLDDVGEVGIFLGKGQQNNKSEMECLDISLTIHTYKSHK